MSPPTHLERGKKMIAEPYITIVEYIGYGSNKRVYIFAVIKQREDQFRIEFFDVSPDINPKHITIIQLPTPNRILKDIYFRLDLEPLYCWLNECIAGVKDFEYEGGWKKVALCQRVKQAMLDLRRVDVRMTEPAMA